MVILQGVIEFSLSLFFAKLVSYTFLYWLPEYIRDSSTCIVHVATYPRCNSSNRWWMWHGGPAVIVLLMFVRWQFWLLDSPLSCQLFWQVHIGFIYPCHPCNLVLAKWWWCTAMGKWCLQGQIIVAVALASVLVVLALMVQALALA